MAGLFQRAALAADGESAEEAGEAAVVGGRGRWPVVEGRIRFEQRYEEKKRAELQSRGDGRYE